MEPVTIVSAAAETYKTLGIVGFLLICMFLGVRALWMQMNRREKRMSEALDACDSKRDAQTKEYAKTAENLVLVVERNSVALTENSASNRAIVDALRARPCMIEIEAPNRPKLPSPH